MTVTQHAVHYHKQAWLLHYNNITGQNSSPLVQGGRGSAPSRPQHLPNPLPFVSAEGAQQRSPRGLLPLQPPEGVHLLV